MASENDPIKKDFEELRASLDKLSQDVSSLSKSMAEDIKSRASRKADDVQQGARDMASEIGERGRESAATVEKAVQERPMQSLLFAFGAGLLLSQLINRR